MRVCGRSGVHGKPVDPHLDTWIHNFTLNPTRGCQKPACALYFLPFFNQIREIEIKRRRGPENETCGKTGPTCGIRGPTCGISMRTSEGSRLSAATNSGVCNHGSTGSGAPPREPFEKSYRAGPLPFGFSPMSCGARTSRGAGSGGARRWPRAGVEIAGAGPARKARTASERALGAAICLRVVGRWLAAPSTALSVANQAANQAAAQPEPSLPVRCSRAVTSLARLRSMPRVSRPWSK